MTNAAVDVFQWIDTKDGNEKVCWTWLGSYSGKDKERAMFQYSGTRVQAHRLVFELVHGPLGEDEIVRHKCDNPSCLNPFHMERGSREENERDKYARDRAGMPVRVLREIRRLLEAGVSHTKTARMVSEKFDTLVTRNYVTKIALGYRRAHGNEQTAEEIVNERIGNDYEEEDDDKD